MMFWVSIKEYLDGFLLYLFYYTFQECRIYIGHSIGSSCRWRFHSTKRALEAIEYIMIHFYRHDTYICKLGSPALKEIQPIGKIIEFSCWKSYWVSIGKQADDFMKKCKFLSETMLYILSRPKAPQILKKNTLSF